MGNRWRGSVGPDGRGARVGGPPGWAGAFRLLQASVELLRKPGCLRFEIRQKLGFPWMTPPHLAVESIAFLGSGG